MSSKKASKKSAVNPAVAAAAYPFPTAGSVSKAKAKAAKPVKITKTLGDPKLAKTGLRVYSHGLAAYKTCRPEVTSNPEFSITFEELPLGAAFVITNTFAEQIAELSVNSQDTHMYQFPVFIKTGNRGALEYRRVCFDDTDMTDVYKIRLKSSIPVMPLNMGMDVYSILKVNPIKKPKVEKPVKALPEIIKEGLAKAKEKAESKSKGKKVSKVSLAKIQSHCDVPIPNGTVIDAATRAADVHVAHDQA